MSAPDLANVPAETATRALRPRSAILADLAAVRDELTDVYWAPRVPDLPLSVERPDLCARLNVLRAELRASLEDEVRQADEEIGRAYWVFTRTANGKPPSLVCPDAYARREQALRDLATLASGHLPEVGMCHVSTVDTTNTSTTERLVAMAQRQKRTGAKPQADGYESFLASKLQISHDGGFAPVWEPEFLFPFQRALVEWSLRKGRSAIFANCGLGKSPMQLVWAENVVRKTNKPVIILTPLAVTGQMVREAEKFGIEAHRSHAGELRPGINITNYERLHHFNQNDFAGVVCDESSILKSFEGDTRKAITDFMRVVPYRLLCTATPSPNDFVELGTSSDALGYLGFMDMLSRFFKNARNNASLGRAWMTSGGGAPQWRFRGHAERPFWRWVCSWARAVTMPSDMGFSDEGFVLPPLREREHIIEASDAPEGLLFSVPAVGLAEERAERRRTMRERCEKVASLVADTGEAAVCWAHLNDEADMLERVIPGAIQVSGRDSDDAKEEKFAAFERGEARVLVTKPIIGAWGLNWQHCAHTTMFSGHSFEQYYQSVRRFWRFGQKRPVTVDHVLSEGEGRVLANLRRKSEQAERMFASLAQHIGEEMSVARGKVFTKEEVIPTWV